MEYTYMSFLMDFSYMSILLIIAQFMRAKIKFLQNFFYSGFSSGWSAGIIFRTAVFGTDSLERKYWLLRLHAGMRTVCRFISGKERKN